MDPLLSESLIEQILGRLPSLTVGVLGDLFLDRYLELDARLTEPSLETGLDAYQVVHVRSIPGAAGTVLNNLEALGVRRICTISVIGDDGEGHELRQALDDLGVVDTNWVFYWESRRTPTYVKPMLHEAGKPARELNRLDIKNRTPLPHAAEHLVLKSLEEVWPQVDALLVLDQVSDAECGVVTSQVRQRLAEWGEEQHGKLILADSRERIGLFRAATLKPNAAECVRAILGPDGEQSQVEACTIQLAERCGRPVFCTCGERGILLADPLRAGTGPRLVPAYPVTGPIDVVGAGDSTSAAIACAVASGATLEQAAAFGNLVASITVQQLGTTGTASPEQVRRQWQEIHSL
jgi:rfaE bifunctional protein kinase chain/domain